MKLHLPKILLTAVLSAVSVASADQFTTPVYGGVEWTYSTEDNTFHNGDSTSSAPGRSDDRSKGAVLIFNNVGTVTANAGADTSDYGGIKVTGDSVVTSNLWGWAGSIYVGEGSVLNAFYSNSLKNTEAEGVANVWIDGTLTFYGRSNIDINDGNSYQNWHIGESGLINFGCADFVKGDKTLYLEVIVDADGLDGLTNRAKEQGTFSRTIATMTSGGNIYETLQSNCTIYDTEGNVLSDASLTDSGTSVQVTYNGTGYRNTSLTTSTDVAWTANGTEEGTLFEDASGTKTSFINGDSVTVIGNATVTAQMAVTADALVLNNGSVVLNGYIVSASSLELSGTVGLDFSVSGSSLSIESLSVADNVTLNLKGNWSLSTLATNAYTFTKGGEGTLTLSNTGNLNGGTLNITEGTVEVTNGNSYQGVLTNTTVNVSAGATFKSSGHDALGWGTGHTAKIVLNGEKDKEAIFENADTGSNTLVTDIQMNGYAKVTGSQINTFGGNISATGYDNVIESNLQIRKSMTFTVNSQSDLTLTGKLTNHADNLSPVITITGGGSLIVSGTESDFNGNWVVSGGSTLWLDGDSAVLGTGAVSLSLGSSLKTYGDITLANTVTGTGSLVVEGGSLSITGDVTLAKTVYVYNGEDSSASSFAIGEGGSLSFDSPDGLQAVGETGFSDTTAGSSDNGFISGAYYIVYNGGSVSNSISISSVTIGGTEYSVTLDEGGHAVAFVDGQRGAYYINSGEVIYGEADSNAAASDSTTGLVLNGGSLTMQSSLNENATAGITVLSDSSISLGSNAVLKSSSVTVQEDATLTLSGSGTYDLGNNPALTTNKGIDFNATLDSSWTGTVSLSGLQIGGFADNSGAYITALNDLGNENSWVQVSGLTGYAGTLDSSGKKIGSPTITANLILKDTAMTLTDGSSGSTTTFSGKIKGEGNVVYTKSGLNNPTFAFTGDVSEWSGAFQATNASGSETVKFGNGATNVQAGVKNTGSGTLSLNVSNDNAVTFSGSVTNSGTGTLNISTDGNGAKTFSGGITATSLSVSGGAVTLSGTNVIGSVTITSGSLILGSDSNTLTAVEIASGATLDASASVGMGGSLTLADSSELILSASDGVSLSGTLSLGSELTLTIVSLARTATSKNDYSYTLATGVTSLGNGEWTEVDAKNYFSQVTVNGTTLSLDHAVLTYDSSSQVLTLSSSVTVPEPTSAALSLIALGALAWRRRRA